MEIGASWYQERALLWTWPLVALVYFILEKNVSGIVVEVRSPGLRAMTC